MVIILSDTHKQSYDDMHVLETAVPVYQEPILPE